MLKHTLILVCCIMGCMAFVACDDSDPLNNDQLDGDLIVDGDTGDGDTGDGDTGDGDTEETPDGDMEPDVADGDEPAEGDTEPDAVDGDTEESDSIESPEEEEAEAEQPEEEAEADIEPEQEQEPEPPAVGDGPGVFINSLSIPEDPCCFDLGGPDGEPDNKYGALLDAFGGLVPDFDMNEEIAAAIADGQYIQLLEFHGVGDWQQADGVGLASYGGQDADADFADNLNPNIFADFLVDPQSVDGNSPLLFTPGGTIEQSGFEIHNATVLIPGFMASFGMFAASGGYLPITHASMTGTLVVATEGDNTLVTIENGRIGGAIFMRDIFAAYNAFVVENCDCLNLGDTPLIDLEDFSCTQEGTNECTDGTDIEQRCDSLYSFCAISTQTLQPDLNIMGGEENDAISMGLTFTGIPAHITGVAGD